MISRSFLYNQFWLYRLVCCARQVFYNWRIGRLTDSYKPLFIILFPFAILYGCIMNILCRGRVAKQMKEDLIKPFDDELSIVTMLKNEAPYVREWIEYYRLLGATRFYIYDNDSQDNVREVISDYIDSGIVVYKYFPGTYRQNVMAYTDAIKNYASKTRFMAVIDLDEFIVPIDDKLTLIDVLKNILRRKPYAAGVAVPWMMYGSSHHKKRPEGLVINNYLYRAQDSFMLNAKSFMLNVKTVFNPRLVNGHNNPHYPVYKYGAFSINENGHIVIGKFDTHKSCKQIRINHYFTKSEEEFRAKVTKGNVDTSSRTFDEFVKWDKNDVYDGIVLRYSEELKRNMQNGPNSTPLPRACVDDGGRSLI
jgi:hypothetical protein